jgi:hypothetical protein
MWLGRAGNVELKASMALPSFSIRLVLTPFFELCWLCCERRRARMDRPTAARRLPPFGWAA